MLLLGFNEIRKKYELLIASVSLSKVNNIQTEKIQLTVIGKHVPVRRAWICCGNKQLFKKKKKSVA